MSFLVVDYSQVTGARMLWEHYPERLQRRLLEAMNQSLIELTKEIKDRVPVKSGTLRRSWNPEFPPKPNTSGAPGFAGRVVSNLSYARFQDQGFHGIEQVRAHVRNVASRSVFEKSQVKVASGLNGGADTFRARRVKVAQGIAYVRAHTREVDYAGRPYTRPSLDAAIPRIVALHEEAVHQAITDVAHG